MLRIKWENITTIFIAIFFAIANTSAFIKAGFNFNVFMFEVLLDAGVLYAWHYIVKNVRKSWQ